MSSITTPASAPAAPARTTAATRPSRVAGEQAGEEHAERDPDAQREPDRVPVAHAASRVVEFRRLVFWTYNSRPPLCISMIQEERP